MMLLGMIIDFNLGQLLKAPFPIEVRLSGNVTETKLLQLRIAYSPMVVTPCGISIEVSPVLLSA